MALYKCIIIISIVLTSFFYFSQRSLHPSPSRRRPMGAIILSPADRDPLAVWPKSKPPLCYMHTAHQMKNNKKKHSRVSSL